MIRVCVTGDNHFGRSFDKYSIKNELIESRFISLEKCILAAEREKCDFFIVTGDLFDRTYSIAKKDIKRVVGILGGFNQRILVLPGNHDYYTENENLWKDFLELSAEYSNIVLLNENRPYEFEVGDDKVCVYPAFCDMKHSSDNRIQWIKEENVSDKNINIGVAHGALEGLAIDTEGIYFPMSKAELSSLPMDIWLLGHAHVTEPKIAEGEEAYGYRIFNAGTHEQLDLHNDTEGNCFIISIDNEKGMKTVSAKRVVCGQIRYFDLKFNFDALTDGDLEDTLTADLKELPDASIVRLTLSGSISQTDYEERYAIYESVLDRFLYGKELVRDDELMEKITKEKIRNEFSEVGLCAKFLERLLDDPIELQMAYEIVKKCNE